MKNKIFKNSIRVSFLLIFAHLFLNCVSSKNLQHNNLVHDREGIDIAATSPDSRLSFFIKKTANEGYCLAPPPDALLNASNDISGSIKTLDNSDKFSDSNSIGATLLSGRTPSVLIIRELLYRACELSVNHSLSKSEVTNIYKTFLEMAEKITKNMQKSNILPTDDNTNND
ncbi:hypothetical protein OD91_2061 [Lutibacter sp. Hel_I_33_5]|uniref:hypothetical protein n=1 Tax=Lutibacter sp. Hel_I_33_5 TaxID=1566289 RepID=UPI0011A26C09|nr:hypothetical protein [Lutibacter sp. Hel_I_33_5]TVZ56763.1 hypothetical protein OD91_2061 [Lutibacter sp. Hel_I_33_5]